jgi:glycosyltransferase involved in cell wall biosynthesis
MSKCDSPLFDSLKIRLVITNAPPLVGGLEKVCLRLAQNLQKLGNHVTILGRFTQGRHQMEDFFSVSEKNQNLECEGVNVRVLTLDAKARLLLKPVFKLIWRKSTFPLAHWLYVEAMRGQIAASSRGADVVHFFGNGPEMLGFAAEAAARQVSAKFVVEPALHEGQCGDKWFDALLYKRADLLLAHTRYEAGVLERMGMPATKIRTIVHGVDFCDSGDGESFRKKHGISGPMVLFLGRKTREKGVERLLKAWPTVAEKFPEATIVFAGPKSDALRQMADGKWRMVDGRGTPEDRRSKIGDEVGTTNHTTPARQRIVQGEVECVGWESTGAKRSEGHEKGNGDLTTIELWGRCEKEQPNVGPKGEGVGSTESKDTVSTEGEAGLRPGNRASAPEPDSLASELADSPVSESLTRFASSPASSLATSYPLPVTAPRARVLNLDDLAEGEKQDALAACDLLCVPSEGESFGMVYFEAWAYKKPVVALDLPVLRETIGAAEAGILVKNDPCEVAAAITKLLSAGELRRAMGANGHQLALHHKWEEATQHYVQGYAEALKHMLLCQHGPKVAVTREG